jgi:hypothetical protein
LGQTARPFAEQQPKRIRAFKETGNADSVEMCGELHLVIVNCFPMAAPAWHHEGLLARTYCGEHRSDACMGDHDSGSLHQVDEACVRHEVDTGSSRRPKR